MNAQPSGHPGHTVYLGLGANLGDRDATLRAALAALNAPPQPADIDADADADIDADARVDATWAAPSDPATTPIVRVDQVSSVWDTAPLLLTEQPRFHNIACQGQTGLTPIALLLALKQIERRLGRTSGVRYGPRAIDIDILFYDDLILRAPDLSIPHERIAERAFVLLPLAEIAPDLRHPVLGRDIRSLAGEALDADVQRLGPLLPPEQPTVCSERDT